MKIKLSSQQIQKQVLAPSMQQSIEMLILPLAELSMAIDQELQDNPLLEALEDKNSAEQQFLDQYIQHTLNHQKETPHLDDYNFNLDEDLEEKPVSRTAPLEEDLLQQLRLEITDPLEIKIGEFIIGQLDEDGYLSISCEDIAQLLGLPDTNITEKVLKTVQSFEPLGIASRNLKECLVTQISFLYNGESQQLINLINLHLENLARKKYQEIAREMNIPLDKVRDFAKVISRLEPKPARNYRPISPNIYVKPDVVVVKAADDSYQVHVNRESIPRLRINPVYQSMLRHPNRTEEEKLFIREKIKNGLLFMKSIEQRQHTLKEISQYILTNQKDFFEQGTMAIKPMILKDIATAVNRNESTISRAISNKYIDTPQGMYPLKFFFSRAVNQSGNSSVSSRSIKEDMKHLINDEDKTHPLSDHEIQGHFEEQGVQLARRTISKYRQILEILPSHLRKT